MKLQDDMEKGVRNAQLPSDWEDTGSYALDDQGKLMRVRHQRTDAGGLRKIYTLVGDHMATLSVSEQDAARLDPNNIELMGAMSPGHFTKPASMDASLNAVAQIPLPKEEGVKETALPSKNEED